MSWKLYNDPYVFLVFETIVALAHIFAADRTRSPMYLQMPLNCHMPVSGNGRNTVDGRNPFRTT